MWISVISAVYWGNYCTFCNLLFIKLSVLCFKQSVRNVATQKRNTELDELERELGLDILDDMPSTASHSNAEKPDGAGSNPAQGANKDSFIESALPSRDAGHSRHNSSGSMSGAGCVPTHWVTGIFTGSLPPEQSALLLDWAIVNNSPFAG